MDKSTKSAILQHGLDRIESYRKVIESIQNGVSESESCRLYNVNLSKFRRWCRDTYNQENEVNESFIQYDDFFSWQDALMYAVTEDKNTVATSDFDEAWDYVKTTLTDREAKVLEYRFKESMTLEEIANIFNVNKEVIRQNEKKALRKLRHPKRAKILLYGTKYIDALKSYNKSIEEQRLQEMNDAVAKEISGRFNSVASEMNFDDDTIKGLIVEEAIKRSVSINYDIEDLGLSVRTYNCLKRAGLNTLDDVLNYSDSKGLYEIRNLGLNSFYDLKRAVKNIGCEKDLVYRKS